MMENTAPALQIKTKRGLLKFILLSLITFGIYPLVYFSKISTELNIIASRHDGKKTTHFCLMTFLYSWLTLGIAPFVWFHKMSNRVGHELRRRGVLTTFGAGTFWLWYILGALIGIGPLVYIHKLSKAMNKLVKDYNING